MQCMATNDVFHHLIRLLQIHKDKALLVEIFQAAGVEMTKAKLKAWDTKTGQPARGYREMPTAALQAFIDELYRRKLVVCDDDA